MEVTNNLIKWVYSLSQKKNRDKEGCFVAEGTKCVMDTIGHFRLRYLFATGEWIETHDAGEAIVATRQQLDRMSMLKTPADVIAVYEIPKSRISPEEFRGTLSIALDDVQDPGNLGTIIRIADWFGIRSIVCSRSTVDAYNPKVVQATMGAISRVRVEYCDLEQLFAANPDLPVYGTFLDGADIYREELGSEGFILMGNEGKGISRSLEKHVGKRLLIPSYPAGVPTSESLNVGMATAIVVSEFRRRMI